MTDICICMICFGAFVKTGKIIRLAPGEVDL